MMNASLHISTVYFGVLLSVILKVLPCVVILLAFALRGLALKLSCATTRLRCDRLILWNKASLLVVTLTPGS
jgi:hypothetical protein